MLHGLLVRVQLKLKTFFFWGVCQYCVTQCSVFCSPSFIICCLVGTPWLMRFCLCVCVSKSRQVDMNSKNVFGQPRLRASLRDLRSPRRSHKSTVEDDLKKLIIMDNPADPVPQREKVLTLVSFTDKQHSSTETSCFIERRT